jgi:transposase
LACLLDWQGNRGLGWERLPTDCPELNPVECFFEQLRAGRANQVFESKQQVKRLSLYPYISKCA